MYECLVLTKEFFSREEVRVVLNLWNSKTGCSKTIETASSMIVRLSCRHRVDKTVPHDFTSK